MKMNKCWLKSLMNIYHLLPVDNGEAYGWKPSPSEPFQWISYNDVRLLHSSCYWFHFWETTDPLDCLNSPNSRNLVFYDIRQVWRRATM